MVLVPSLRVPAISAKTEYRLIVAVVFPLFLVETACRRLWRAGRRHSPGTGQSIVAEARTASINASLLAFQG